MYLKEIQKIRPQLAKVYYHLSKRQTDDVFLILQENRIWLFMQIVSLGYNLHDMSNALFGKKQEKKIKLSSREILLSMLSIKAPKTSQISMY